MPKENQSKNHAEPKPKKAPPKRPIEQYDHKSKKRINNPPVGLVTPQTDPPTPTHRTYEYDPHLDPQLVWAGKKEHTSFEVPTVSLHVHERIDPRTIIEAVRRRNGNGRPVQGYLFETREENPPLREAIDFYRHAHGWSNRLIAGDSLLVMNSLLEKEGLAGQVQMVYIDPPYGIRYGSNFQPFVNRRDVKDGKDEDLTQEPEMVRAFRDTWELGIHSYLTYLRDRLLLARDLLHESGSCFVQISDENLHHVRELMDDVFAPKNFVVLICYKRLGMMVGEILKSSAHYLVWYAKDADKLKFKKLYEPQIAGTGVGDHYNQLENKETGEIRAMRKEERGNPQLQQGWNPFQLISIQTYGLGSTAKQPFTFDGQNFTPGPNKAWRTTEEGLKKLANQRRIMKAGNTIRYKQYLSDFPFVEVRSIWDNTGRDPESLYVVQTPTSIIQRCVLMTTDPGDLVFDPTCGSGTTAFVAEQWGRRWITCDTSRVATTLAKQRLMCSTFDYYKLAHPNEGVGNGFEYKKVPHITLKSIANNEPPGEETLYDQPLVDNSRARISGPFTVEAVPAPNVKSIDDFPGTGHPESPLPLRGEGSAFSSANLRQPADVSIARSGPTLRQSDWRDELLKTGIRGKGGQMINFSRVEPLGGTRWLHADAETKNGKPERVVISFGPDYAPLITTQVEMAWEEARTLHPKPAILVFAAFQFDPEAAKDIDDLTKEKTGMTFLTAQMNADLLTDDLKKKRSSNQSFWLVGRPDVELRPAKPSDSSGLSSRTKVRDPLSSGLYIAEVRGFDYYNTRTGTIESGDTKKIAMWLLDTDYDGRSLYPRQVFFPLADEDEGWAKLARNLKAEIDPDLIEHYRGTVSLPFALGEHKRVAVKVIDDRGIESLKVMQL
ncbi:MAG: site-specific DNA-methyltransferase [Candidatus Acidiferrales bacterium]